MLIQNPESVSISHKCKQCQPVIPTAWFQCLIMAWSRGSVVLITNSYHHVVVNGKTTVCPCLEKNKRLSLVILFYMRPFALHA